MAYPAGMQLVSVTVGSALSWHGEDRQLSVQIRPALGGNAKRLIWAATGQVVVPETATYKADPGNVVSFTLPHPAYPGLIDGTGNEVLNWSYHATITAGPETWTQAFQPVEGQFIIDLDLVPDGQVTAPTSAPVPAVTSVNGQTGAVVVEGGGEGVSDADMAARINDTETLTHAAVAGLVPEGPAGPPGPGTVVLPYGGAVPEPQAEGVLYVRLLEPSGDFAPAILTQPQPASVVAGGSVTLTSSASGQPAPTAQWLVGGVAIPGATGASLQLDDIDLADNGAVYTVTWTNTLGSVTSNGATLTVTAAPVEAPTITQHPASQTVTDGDTVTLTAAATGADSIQWQVNTGSGWADISGATTGTHTFTAAVAESGYQYRCGFTNAGGTTWSNAATLTVNEEAPTETMVFEDLFNRADGDAIVAPWTLDTGTAAVIDSNALRVDASGYHRVTPGEYATPLRIEATIAGSVLRFTGLFFGRSATDPVTYPGVKVATTQAELGFGAMSAETVFGTTLDNLSDLTAAVAPDEAVGGVLGVQWDGSDLTLYWNGQVVEVAPGAPIAPLVAPTGLVGIIGSSTTSVRWDDFRVWSL